MPDACWPKSFHNLSRKGETVSRLVFFRLVIRKCLVAVDLVAVDLVTVDLVAVDLVTVDLVTVDLDRRCRAFRLPSALTTFVDQITQERKCKWQQRGSAINERLAQKF